MNNAMLPLAEDQQLKALGEIAATATSLQGDVYCFVQRTVLERSRFENEEITLEEMSFWFKCVAHSTLAFAEGLCHAIRRVLRRHSTKLEAEVGPRKLEPLVDLEKNLSLRRNLSDSFRLLPRLFGAKFELNTSGADYRAFLALLDARESFTHPKEPAAIHPFGLLAAMNSGVEWLLHSWRELLLACAMNFRHNVVEAPPRRFPFHDQRLRDFDSFGREYSASRQRDDFFGTLSPMVFDLLADTGRAMTLVTGKEHSEAPIPTDVALRNLVRFLFSEIEGTTFIAASFLYRYGLASEPPTKELLIGEHKIVRERIANTLEEFSRRFGDDVSIPRKGTGWKAFVTSRELRNRLMHPGHAQDLSLSQEHLDALLRLLEWWHGKVNDCLHITSDERKLDRIIAAERSGLRDLD